MYRCQEVLWGQCRDVQYLSPGQDRERSPCPRLLRRDSSTLCRWPAGLVAGDCKQDQAPLPASTLPDCHLWAMIGCVRADWDLGPPTQTRDQRVL